MSVYHPGGNCDTLNATSVTVRATSASSCNRFGDIFNFSSLDWASIDHFDVTLSFSGAQDGFFERWNTRGAPNYVVSATTFGDFLNASGTQTFTFASSAAQFNSIVAAEQFVLSFAQNGLGGSGSSFTLNSARLDVFGSAAAAVPEPSSLALVGLLLAGGTLVGRSRKGGAA
nr:PEP-CTERM sorting domain-containing protein [Schlegelella koreensis]